MYCQLSVESCLTDVIPDRTVDMRVFSFKRNDRSHCTNIILWWNLCLRPSQFQQKDFTIINFKICGHLSATAIQLEVLTVLRNWLNRVTPIVQFLKDTREIKTAMLNYF